MSKIFDLLAKFNLLAKNIKNLDLKLAGKLPVDRDELLALANTWGRDDFFYIYDKNGNEIIIEKCRAKEKYNLSKLDVSEIKNFDRIFTHSNFNGDINSWDVSNGTSMEFMFYLAKKFNSPLDKWDASKVTDMSYMFKGARYFNQNINSWNVSNVTSMKSMFSYTENFNQPLDKWNVYKVIDMSSMFEFTKKFNFPLDNWNTSNVTSMYSMFACTKNFNQNIDMWDVSNVKDMEYMFYGTEAFNKPILWDLSNIEYGKGMFYKSKLFKSQFNNGKELPFYKNQIKEWLEENRDRMIALNVKISKAKELNKFLLNISLQNKSFIEKLFIKFKYL